MRNHPLARQPAVYILANGKNGTLYIGVTMNLPERVWQHKNHVNIDGFTARYDVHDLVWYEFFENMPEAVAKEKTMKKWRREWKIKLIEEQNPEWLDLSGVLFVQFYFWNFKNCRYSSPTYARTGYDGNQRIKLRNRCLKNSYQNQEWIPACAGMTAKWGNVAAN